MRHLFHLARGTGEDIKDERLWYEQGSGTNVDVLEKNLLHITAQDLQ